MIVTSRIAKLTAGAVALAAHGAFALTLSGPEPVRTEGGAGGAEVRLGSSFADMAVGRVAAEAPVEVAMANAPDRAVPQQTSVMARRVTPPPTAAAAVQAEPVTPATPAPSAAAPVASSAPAVLPTPAAPAADTTERITADMPRTAAVSRSLRPRMRSPELETANRPKPAPQGGGAARNARAGKAAGTENAKALTSGAPTGKPAPGNAEASNYPGQVMRVLSRAGRPRVNTRGAALVSFTISASGGVASATVARSSGSAALDRAAIQIVRNAAPFPRPPANARRSFSVEIKGR